MRASQFVTSALLVVGITSCCQTVWLDVTRRAGGSQVAVELPDVKRGPIPLPRFENRFLPGATVTNAQAYTDQFDPRNDTLEEMTLALTGLDGIVAGRGDHSPRESPVRGSIGFVDARVKCGKHECVSLIFDPGVLTPTNLNFVPTMARVQFTGPTGVVDLFAATMPCEIEGTAVAATGQTPACPIGTKGTRIVLTRPVPVADGTVVRVELGLSIGLARSLLTFVHMSDTQLRDPDVKLTNPVLSAQLDHLVESFEHDEDQELYGPELAEALVATINEEVVSHPDSPNDAPSFVIHTGDSIDSNTRRELRLFHEIMDRLTIPWFNLLGNHDVLVFGNFLPASDAGDKRCVSQKTIVAPYIDVPRWLIPGRLCVPKKITGEVGELDAYVAGPTHAESRKTFIEEHRSHNRAKVVATKSMKGCDGVFMPGAYDRQHGFDLYPRSASTDPIPGYYAFATELGTTLDGFDRRAIFIALNSEDLLEDEGGNSGRIGADQEAWLGKALACAAPHDLVFIFAHHQIDEVKLPLGGTLRNAPMMKSPNIVGYLYGHSHKHGLCRAKSSCTRFWELESGSLIEHPQEARLIRLKTVGAGLAFIETTVFTERLENPVGTFAQRVNFARRGADRDHCLRERCSRDERVRRSDGRFTNARLFFPLP